MPYFRAFLRAVEGEFWRHIQLIEPVLDVGCGDGLFAYCSFDGPIFCGIDQNYASLLEARDLRTYSNLICASACAIPFKSDEFMTLMSNSVLEHIPDLQTTLSEIFRVLTKNSKFIFCVPNTMFSKNLFFALQLEKIGLRKIAEMYRSFFNKISRHYHVEDEKFWIDKIQDIGLQVENTWRYFSPQALKILELGHIFGIPSLLCKIIFGKWIVVPKMWNLKWIYSYIEKQFLKETLNPKGVYSFYVTHK